MTKEEHLKTATDMVKKNPEKAKAYIRGSLTVQPKGELSDKLRALLDGIKKTQT